MQVVTMNAAEHGQIYGFTQGPGLRYKQGEIDLAIIGQVAGNMSGGSK